MMEKLSNSAGSRNAPFPRQALVVCPDELPRKGKSAIFKEGVLYV